MFLFDKETINQGEKDLQQFGVKAELLKMLKILFVRKILVIYLGKYLF